METLRRRRVLVTGGAGYVGSALIPKLLARGYDVTVLDLFIYGADVFADYRGVGHLREVVGDIRDPATVRDALAGCEFVIHLACISNDPSFDLAPALGKAINYDCFRPLVRAAKDAGATRFINASSSSVYGVKAETDVTEDLPLEPLTDYSRFKAQCEDVLDEESRPGFTTVSIRPATVCGYAPRLRLDLSVNLLTNHAISAGVITVFGGDQRRPSIHISDMTDAYIALLEAPAATIDRQRFNAGHENCSIFDLARRVQTGVGGNVEIKIQPTPDHRSYHISSRKIQDAIGFVASGSIDDAIRDLKQAFEAGLVPRSLEDDRYFNVKRMKALGLR